MHSNRMRTVRCSGCLSCHTRHPLPHMPPQPCTAPCHTYPQCQACPPSHMPSLPCMPPPPRMPSLPHMPPPATHAPPAMHTPPPHMSLLPSMPPPPWTEFLTHACENITFPQLLLRMVIMFFIQMGHQLPKFKDIIPEGLQCLSTHLSHTLTP